MLIATNTRVYFLPGDGSSHAASLRTDSEPVARVAEGDRCEVIAFSDGRLRVARGGRVREIASGITDRIESLLILHPGPPELLIGTEPPHVYRLEGDGPAQRIETLDGLAGRGRWYTPWGGPPAVRSLAATRDGWVYANIHVGAILRSGDRGGRWETVEFGLDEDVHQVATCPADDDRVYANTAGGVYVSADRGLSWQDRGKGLRHRYGRAIAVHPANPDCLLASVSDGPHGQDVHGGLFHSANGGLAWRRVTEGFPATTVDNINTHHVAFSPAGLAWAVVSGTLYISRDRGLRWDGFWAAPAAIEMIACSR